MYLEKNYLGKYFLNTFLFAYSSDMFQFNGSIVLAVEKHDVIPMCLGGL